MQNGGGWHGSPEIKQAQGGSQEIDYSKAEVPLLLGPSFMSVETRHLL